MADPTPADFRPNYDIACEVCGQTPTIDIYVCGKLRSHHGLCGPCCWGEADTIDPENW